jgi:hypothetical protein
MKITCFELSRLFPTPGLGYFRAAAGDEESRNSPNAERDSSLRSE